MGRAIRTIWDLERYTMLKYLSKRQGYVKDVP
jgi:hypothetical protein